MKKKPLTLLAALLAVLPSCAILKEGASSAEGSSSSATESSSAFASVPSSVSSSSSAESSSTSSLSASSSLKKELDYASFWTYGTAVSLSLSFSDAALNALSDYGANYSEKYADVYFPALFTATVGKETYEYPEVGVRMKGATSRTEITDAEGLITDVCHFKVNFGATFDNDYYDMSLFSAFKHDWSSDAAGRQSRKKRTFADMAKLDLKYLPRNDDDQTYSQDIYCYDVFNQNGIQAPKARWVDLALSDASSQKQSSYEAVEDIDEDFLTHHFGEAKGDLYKCTQNVISMGNYTVADLSLSGAVTISTDASGYANGTRVSSGYIGVEDNYSLYHPNYDLKTNDDGENSDFSKMANLINVAWSLRYAKAPYSLLAATIDLSQFLKFEAVSYLLGNFDDQRNNYNNYYVYFRPSDGKAVYIPYDWDYSLGACKSVDVSSFRPFHQSSAHDAKNRNNLYWDTILTTSSLAYASGASESQVSIQAEYRADVSAAKAAGAITYASYVSFIGGLANRISSEDELSLVNSYMTTRNSVLAGY